MVPFIVEMVVLQATCVVSGGVLADGPRVFLGDSVCIFFNFDVILF